MVTNSSPLPGTIDTAAEHGKQLRLARALEVAEPRCRVCRDPLVRRRVNDLLEERRLVNAMINICGASTSTAAAPSKVSYTSILAELEPFNEGLAERDRVTYSSLWVHSRRHESPQGMVAHWAARADKELRRALRSL